MFAKHPSVGLRVADPSSREQSPYGSGGKPEFCTVVWGLTLRLYKFIFGFLKIMLQTPYRKCLL